MTPRERYNLIRAYCKHLNRHPTFNGAAQRNAIQQAAYQHRTTERKVRAAIFPRYRPITQLSKR